MRSSSPLQLTVVAALLTLSCSSPDAPDPVDGGGPGEPDAGSGGGERPSGPVPLTVMSFNVLCSICGGADYDSWAARLEMFADVFARHQPDLLGLQEIMFPYEVEQVLGSEYRGLWYTGEPGEEEAPFPDSTIGYSAARFEERERGFFWLSPEPDKPFSSGFSDGPQLPRVVAWARLTDLEHGGELVFVTTHFDPNSPSQERSSPLLLERLAPLGAGAPLVVTGDFNSEPDDPAYRTLVEGVGGLALTDAFDVAASVELLSESDPPPAYDAAGRIDYVFLGGESVDWEVERFRVDLTRYGDEPRFPSDHRALSADVVLLP